MRGASRQRDGRIGADEVHVVGIRVRRASAPAIDRIEVDLTGVEVDRKVLTRLGGTDLRARLLAADVAAYLATKPALRDVQVGFRAGDSVTLSARPVIGGYALPDAARVSLEGSLLVHGTQLRLVVTDLRVAGFPAGLVPARVVERLINPLLDLASLPAPARIVSARIELGALLISAHADRFPAGS